VRPLILALLLLLYPHPLFEAPPRVHTASRADTAETFLATVTAYSSTDADCGKHDGITATMTKAGPGTIASDWRTFPPGTRLEIPGYGPGVVSDRGEAIRGDKLDVWMHDRAAAKQWGRQRLTVRVIQ
jgi:3D (Asp-Asp-Asp) domain-containing protein